MLNLNGVGAIRPTSSRVILKRMEVGPATEKVFVEFFFIVLDNRIAKSFCDAQPTWTKLHSEQKTTVSLTDATQQDFQEIKANGAD